MEIIVKTIRGLVITTVVMVRTPRSGPGTSLTVAVTAITTTIREEMTTGTIIVTLGDLGTVMRTHHRMVDISRRDRIINAE